jgi:hypothetical protein
MNFAAIAGPHSGRATPFLCDAPATAHDEPNRQRLHLEADPECTRNEVRAAIFNVLAKAATRCRMRFLQQDHGVRGVATSIRVRLLAEPKRCLDEAGHL